MPCCCGHGPWCHWGPWHDCGLKYGHGPGSSRWSGRGLARADDLEEYLMVLEDEASAVRTALEELRRRASARGPRSEFRGGSAPNRVSPG